MVKYLFGVIFLFSIVNFCLQKIVELYGREFEVDMVEIVKCNMYVDDLMKLKSIKEEVIVLVS